MPSFRVMSSHVITIQQHCYSVCLMLDYMGEFQLFYLFLWCLFFLMNTRGTHLINRYYDDPKEIGDEDLLYPNDKDYG